MTLSVSFHLERYYRKRREISRLYKPVNDDSSDGDEDLETGLSQPLFSTPPTAQSALPSAVPGSSKASVPSQQQPALQFKNVWDDRLDLFEIGPDDDDEVPSPTAKR